MSLLSDHASLKFCSGFYDAEAQFWLLQTLEARRAADPDKYLTGLLGAARAKTIETRVRSWERLIRWLALRKGGLLAEGSAPGDRVHLGAYGRAALPDISPVSARVGLLDRGEGRGE